MDLDKSIYISIYSIYIPGYIPGYIYKIYVPGYIYLGYIYHLYIRYIPGHIYQDIYIWGFSPNKNTLEPLRDGINLSIKVPKGALIWHSTVPVLILITTKSWIGTDSEGDSTHLKGLGCPTWCSYHLEPLSRWLWAFG